MSTQIDKVIAIISGTLEGCDPEEAAQIREMAEQISAVFTPPAPSSMASAPQSGLVAALSLAEDQLKVEQAEIREAHEALTAIGAPTNGAEGRGKRQSLTLVQRIKHAPQHQADEMR